MERSEIMKYIQTVTGVISPDEMGFTLPHEHVFWDLSFYLPEDLKDVDEADERKQPVCLENLAQMRYHLTDYSDNVVQQDMNISLKELKWYKEAGGVTICDNGCYGLKCDPVMLREVSQKSGVQIIRGPGAYQGRTLPPDIAKLDVDKLAELFIKEIYEGIGNTGIKCGFIGEIGIDGGLPERSVRSLAAAAIAQKETGAAITIHQPGLEHRADELFKIITDNGGDITKTVMCHCDPFLPEPEYIDHIAKSGAYISFDFFGLEAVLGGTLWLPTDRDRIIGIRKQIELGNLKRILMSHDTAYKCMLRQYGGFGYEHIKKHILPFMRTAGFEQVWLDCMTVENPKDVFSMDVYTN